MSNDFFKMRGIVKQYQMGNEVQTILKGIDLDIEEGEFLSILGPSGSGKSTLMNIIGCLDTPTSGEYILHGRMIRDLDENQLAHIRSKEIGFIFQQFQLLPRLHHARDQHSRNGCVPFLVHIDAERPARFQVFANRDVIAHVRVYLETLFVFAHVLRVLVQLTKRVRDQL